MIGQEPDIAREVTRRVCEAVKIPVIVKLTPDQSRVLDVARAVKEAGAAGVLRLDLGGDWLVRVGSAGLAAAGQTIRQLSVSPAWNGTIVVPFASIASGTCTPLRSSVTVPSFSGRP